MFTIKKIVMILSCSIFVIACSGCTTLSSDSRTIAPEPITESLDDISGIYRLITVNGATLPATVSHGGDIKIYSGEFIINANGTCQSSKIISPPSGGKITRKVNATLTRNGDKLVMKWKGAGKTTGIIKDKTFTMDNKGMIFVYSRTDQAEEIERNTDKAKVYAQTAWAGVFDDFNSGLVNGWDSDRNPIGFFTFSDSKNSVVTISTTSAHPRLPEETDNNEVLKLDLDIKAWGGIIHNFENTAVDEWTPRNWRGFKSISFWLFGQNNNTSLFVEILDNRNPSSTTIDAEVYTYPFTDNFSGWKLITVPFNEFSRKEIGNDAPNDGLGLSEVHGWAFGALNTGGPITYYIDDFSLR